MKIGFKHILKDMRESQVLRVHIDRGPNVRLETEKPEDLADIVESIKQNGVLNPLLLVENPEKPGRYILILGFRRYAATAPELANVEKLPARILAKMPNDTEITLLQIHFDLHNKEFKAHELSRSMSNLACANVGMTNGDIAIAFSVSDAFVSRHLAFVRGCPEVQAAYMAGEFSANVCDELVKLPREQQVMLVERNRQQKLTRDELAFDRKKRKVADKPTVRASRIRCDLPKGSVTASGDGLSLEDFAELAGEAMKAAKRAIADGLDGPTFSKVQAKKAQAQQ